MLDQITPYDHPSRRPRVLLFAASLRQNSHQHRLVRYMADLIHHDCDLDDLRPGDVDLPIFNQDLEREPSLLGSIKALSARFSAVDGIIVACPEYNGHVSPYLKNTIDWISRLPRIDASYATRNPFRDKPLLLSSASTGWSGGALGMRDARSIFSYVGHLVVTDQISVADADTWVQGTTFKFDERFSSHIHRILTDFLDLIRRLRAVQKSSAVTGEQHAG